MWLWIIHTEKSKYSSYDEFTDDPGIVTIHQSLTLLCCRNEENLFST